jgi:antitoxin component of MazEF toxin-antitoxin module
VLKAKKKKRAPIRIAVKPVPLKTYTLDKLLKGITAKTRHKAVDLGRPMGREIW